MYGLRQTDAFDTPVRSSTYHLVVRDSHETVQISLCSLVDFYDRELTRTIPDGKLCRRCLSRLAKLNAEAAAAGGDD